MSFAFDPQVLAGALKLGGGRPRVKAAVGDIETRRTRYTSTYEIAGGFNPAPENVQHQDFYATAEDGANILLRWYSKENESSSTARSQPAVVYMHGGGMISGSVEDFDNIIRHYTSHTGVSFLSVDYRRAPEHPYPVPVEDCYLGLVWLADHAAELGVDPARIAVMGDSAGGGLAACLTHLARKKGGPPIAKQILVYPMLDDRNTVPIADLEPFAVWTCDDNITGWGALLGGQMGGKDADATAAAGRMSEAEAAGLPPIYLDVGELDIFRDECLVYAGKCLKAGVSVELHLHRSCPHAYDVLAPEADVTKRTMADRFRAVCNI